MSSGTGERVASAAVLIAVLTAASRLAGFARVLVFTWAVGLTDLADIYQAANTVPNIIFEIVAGGALASLVVPLLVAADRRSRAEAAATAGALLTWVVTLLVPVALVVALAAHPLVRLLAPEASPAAVDTGADMLRVFAPQLPLYGVGIVLTGVLQTYRRFTWPQLAPLLSSLTVMAAYLVFRVVAGRGAVVGSVGTGGLLVLSVGTTLGVAVLSLCLLAPLGGLRLGLRPRYRMGVAAAGAVRRLAGAGVAVVAAQQLSLGLAIALASQGPEGSVALYGLAQTVYLVPWAVLALPVATSTYPALAEAGTAGDDARYAAALAPAIRSVLLLGCFGAAALACVAWPAARLLYALAAHPTSGPSLPVTAYAGALLGFAPGLPGYALFALLSRALYARGANRLAAAVTVVGWAAVAAASVALAVALPTRHQVTALAAGNAVGVTVLGAALLVAVARRCGPRCLAGLGRSALVGLTAAGAAAAAGMAVTVLAAPTRTPTTVGTVGQGMLGGIIVVAVFAAVAAAIDPRDTRPALAGLLRRLCRMAATAARGPAAAGRSRREPRSPAGKGTAR